MGRVFAKQTRLTRHISAIVRMGKDWLASICHRARANMESNKRSGTLRWAYVVFAMALALVSTLTTAQGQAEFSEWSLPVTLRQHPSA